MGNSRKRPRARVPQASGTTTDAVDIETLRFDAQNARTHPEANLDLIRQAVATVGVGRSIVIDEAGTILAGEGAVRGAKAAGVRAVKIIDTDRHTLVAVRRTDLTDDEKVRLALLDNRTGELAQWNGDVLRALAGQGIDLEALGFDDDLLADLVGTRTKAGLTDPDAQPDTRTTTIERGQIFALGEHRLICGDATSGADVAAVLGGDRIDLVVTSPPYNVNIKYRSHHDRAERDEYLSFIARTAAAFVPHLAPGRFVAWNIGVSPKTFPARQVVALEDAGLTFYRQIVWKKSGVAYPVFPSSIRTKRARHYKPNYTHEVVQVFESADEGDVPTVLCALCEGGGTMAVRELPSAEAHETVQLLVNGSEELGETRAPDRRYACDVWEIHQSQASVGLKTVGTRSGTLTQRGKPSHAIKEHPAAFPAELPRAVMGLLTGVGEVVFEPFGGSGTTLIACEQLGRRARVTEIDPVYCQLIIDRWEAFTGRQAERL